MKKYLIIWLVLVVLDQMVKKIFVESGSFVQNTGMIFGVFSENNALFLAVGFLILIVLISFFMNEARYRLGLSFIIAGAVSNLVDRINHGYVVDFIDFRIWPVFNLADMFIFIGVIIIFVIYYKERKIK